MKMIVQIYSMTSIADAVATAEAGADLIGVADAQGSEVDRCLEDFVPEYAFNFYYWTIEPSYSSCVELLKRLGFDSDTEPKVIKIHDNPDYK